MNERRINRMEEYYKKVCDNGFYSSPKRLRFYLENQLFKDIDFKGKTLIDIGGGNGLFGFYAALNGAKRVIIMEPEFDGSTKGITIEFEKINSLLGNLDNIELTTKILEDYHSLEKFDIVLMHNSINHINEEACITLDSDLNSQKIYNSFFEKLSSFSKNEGLLLIHDCSNRNFYNDIGLVSPFAKSIEWEKHQPPEIWEKSLNKVGYKKYDLSWTSFNAMGHLGKFFLGNRISTYFTHSAFLLKMKKVVN